MLEFAYTLILFINAVLIKEFYQKKNQTPLWNLIVSPLESAILYIVYKNPYGTRTLLTGSQEKKYLVSNGKYAVKNNYI